MAEQTPETATLAPPAVAQPVKITLRTRTARSRKAPKKSTAKRASKAQNLAVLAARLETQWGTAMEAHQARVRRDFAELQKALKAKPAKSAKDAKLQAILGKKAKPAKGRLKDLRRAENALGKALDRIKA